MRLRIGILFLILIAIAACNLMPSDYDPYWPDIQIDAPTPAMIGGWLAVNITYSSGGGLQSPETTYRTRRGDCSDFAVLMMYLIRWQVGGPRPEFIFGEYKGTPHAWVRYEGRDYEPQAGLDITESPLFVQVGSTISYEQALWDARQ